MGLVPHLLVLLAAAPTAAHAQLAWCDTIECSLLMTRPSPVEFGTKNGSNHIYIPGDDLLAQTPDLSAYYAQPMRSLMHRPRRPVEPVYVAELGRLQDALFDPTNRRGVADLVEEVRRGLPYGFYAGPHTLSLSDCMDEAGLRTNSYFGINDCMTLLVVDAALKHAYLYTGPVSFNRVDFENVAPLLRYLVTNGTIVQRASAEVTRRLSQRHFPTCKLHQSGSCFTIFHPLQFAQLCCYGLDQTDGRTLRTRRYNACPTADFHSHRRLKVRLQDVSEVRDADQDHCMANITLHFKRIDVCVVQYVSFNGSSTFTCVDVNARCALDFQQHYSDKKKVINFSCYCRPGVMCMNDILALYPAINEFAGVNRRNHSASTFCQRFHPGLLTDELVCYAAYDLLARRLVALQPRSNIGEVYALAPPRRLRWPTADRDDAILLQLLGVGTREQPDCPSPAYQPYYSPRLIPVALFQCSYPYCDVDLDAIVPYLVQTIPTSPLCAAYLADDPNDPFFIPFSHSFQKDVDTMLKHFVLLNATAGYCTFAYYGLIDHIDQPGYRIHPATASFVEHNNCSADYSSGCVWNEESNAMCCVPFFRGANFADYAQRMVGAFMAVVREKVYSDTAERILTYLKTVGTCTVYNKFGGMESCARLAGCFSETTYSKGLGVTYGGCRMSEHTVSHDTFAAHHPRPRNTGCLRRGLDRLFEVNDDCILVENNETRRAGPTDAELRKIWAGGYDARRHHAWQNMVCCCDRSGRDCLITETVTSYADYLDENEAERLPPVLRHLDQS